MQPFDSPELSGGIKMTCCKNGSCDFQPCCIIAITFFTQC